MKKFVPFEKMSKKQQRAINNEKRNTWGDINPVTRKSENKKAYNRKKCRDWDEPDYLHFFVAEHLIFQKNNFFEKTLDKQIVL